MIDQAKKSHWQNAEGKSWDKNIFYPLNSVPGRMNDCGCSHNDTGSVADALKARDAFINEAKSKCDQEHPVAKKFKTTVGGKPWNNCFKDRMEQYDALVAANKKKEDKLELDAPINAAIESLNAPSASPSTASDASGGGISPTVIYAGAGIVFLLVLLIGFKMYKNNQEQQSQTAS